MAVMNPEIAKVRVWIKAHPQFKRYSDFLNADSGIEVSREEYKDQRYRVLTLEQDVAGEQESAAEFTIPPNINLIPEPPMQLELRDWIYASDFHVPLHNHEYINHIVRVGKASGIKDLVIGGDLFDFDSLSRHPKTEQQAGYRRTKELGGDLLYELSRLFRIYILPGNHDERLKKKLDEFVDFADIIWAGLAGRVPYNPITVTNYDYIYVGPEETGWVVGHPRYFSTVPARGGADVAMIKHRNVIGAHNHIQGLMRSRCGRYISIDPGHNTEPDMTPYKVRSDGLSKYPSWSPGFVLIRNNIPTLCGDGLVDWAQLERAA